MSVHPALLALTRAQLSFCSLKEALQTANALIDLSLTPPYTCRPRTTATSPSNPSLTCTSRTSATSSTPSASGWSSTRPARPSASRASTTTTTPAAALARLAASSPAADSRFWARVRYKKTYRCAVVIREKLPLCYASNNFFTFPSVIKFA